jgi:hypothetical protein
MDSIRTENDFIEYLENKKIFMNIFKDFKLTKINKEYTFKNSNRRIDFLIECFDSIILCEVKHSLNPFDVSQIMSYKLLAHNEFKGKKIYSFLICYTENSFDDTLMTINLIQNYDLDSVGFTVIENDKYFYYENNQFIRDFMNLNELIKNNKVKSMFNNSYNTEITAKQYREKTLDELENTRFYQPRIIKNKKVYHSKVRNIIPLSSPRRKKDRLNLL